MESRDVMLLLSLPAVHNRGTQCVTDVSQRSHTVPHVGVLSVCDNRNNGRRQEMRLCCEWVPISRRSMTTAAAATDRHIIMVLLERYSLNVTFCVCVCYRGNFTWTRYRSNVIVIVAMTVISIPCCYDTGTFWCYSSCTHTYVCVCFHVWVVNRTRNRNRGTHHCHWHTVRAQWNPEKVGKHRRSKQCYQMGQQLSC